MTIQVDKLRYPIIIEIPEDYWCYSSTPGVEFEYESTRAGESGAKNDKVIK
jgi:hypothetical protein